MLVVEISLLRLVIEVVSEVSIHLSDVGACVVPVNAVRGVEGDDYAVALVDAKNEDEDSSEESDKCGDDPEDDLKRSSA